MQLTRNRFLCRAAAAGLALLVCGGIAGTSVAAARAPEAPHLPPGFKKAFTSKFVNARVAEEAPEQMLAALTEFLAPYRDASPAR